jgi:hypothetical protein
VRDKEELLRILQAFKSGEITLEETMNMIWDRGWEDLGFAKVDYGRLKRIRIPEVIFCPGKNIDEITVILKKLYEKNGRALATRASQEVWEAVKDCFPQAEYYPRGRVIVVGELPQPRGERYVAVVTGGTSDIPVGEEAVVTLRFLGERAKEIYDVGIAGVHRLLDNTEQLRGASLIIAVAGMEGALPSLLASLLGKPIIAVPTSVGYGASFGGIAPLLSMLNSCAPGIAVVNIDGGFSASVFAHLLLQSLT